MHYLKGILVLFLLLLSSAAFAQTGVYLQPRMSYGTFRMSSAKELQQTIITRTGVNAKATDTFGANFLPGGSVKLDLGEQAQVGLFYERGASGGRVSYADYSGEIKVDMPVTYRAVGFIFDTHKPLNNSSLEVVGGVEASYIRSTMAIEINNRIYEYTESSTNAFVADGGGIKPYAGLQYPLFRLPLVFTVGYLVHASGPYHVAGNKEEYLIRNEQNGKLEPSWSGLRINFAISVPLFRL